jgi:hypothetical protein
MQTSKPSEFDKSGDFDSAFVGPLQIFYYTCLFYLRGEPSEQSLLFKVWTAFVSIMQCCICVGLYAIQALMISFLATVIQFTGSATVCIASDANNANVAYGMCAVYLCGYWLAALLKHRPDVTAKNWGFCYILDLIVDLFVTSVICGQTLYLMSYKTKTPFEILTIVVSITFICEIDDNLCDKIKNMAYFKPFLEDAMDLDGTNDLAQYNCRGPETFIHKFLRGLALWCGFLVLFALIVVAAYVGNDMPVALCGESTGICDDEWYCVPVV